VFPGAMAAALRSERAPNFAGIESGHHKANLAVCGRPRSSEGRGSLLKGRVFGRGTG
jgi:hypothetical protein